MRVLHQVAALQRQPQRGALRLCVFAAVTVVVVACSSNGDDGISPARIVAAAGIDTAANPPRDTTSKPPRDTTKKPPRDTVDTIPPLPAKVAVSGRVLGIVVIAPAPDVRDTLRFDAVAGAKVRIMRNVLVNGAAAQIHAADLITDKDGRFSINDLPGGYYVVYADPPAGSIWASSFSYLAATKPEVRVDVYLWPRGAG